jgi:hypothetical protein
MLKNRIRLSPLSPFSMGGAVATVFAQNAPKQDPAKKKGSTKTKKEPTKKKSDLKSTDHKV